MVRCWKNHSKKGHVKSGKNKKDVVLEGKSLRMVRDDPKWNFGGCVIIGMWGWGKSSIHSGNHLPGSDLRRVSEEAVLTLGEASPGQGEPGWSFQRMLCHGAHC